jgi:glycosyltransferase involved in cell wall biosynthesis
VPPPLVGSSYAVQLLLESSFARSFDLVHIDTAFASSVADMGRPSLTKVARLARYLFALVRERMRGLDAVIIVPAYTRVPFFKDALGVILARWILRVPVILWTNSNRLPVFHQESGKVMRAFIRFILRSAVRVIAPGEKFRADLEKFVAPDRIVVIPNGVPDPGQLPRRTEQGSSARVLYLSNMLRSKGWPELLQAAHLLAMRYPDLRVDFHGSPGSDAPAEELKQAFASSQFPDAIRWHGPVQGDAKAEAFRAADIFCLPTAYPTEAHPLAILEAMSYALPVVSCRTGAVEEMVEHDVTGLLVPVRDPDALAAALDRLIRDPRERLAMGERGRARFEESLSAARMGERFTMLIDELGRVA